MKDKRVFVSSTFMDLKDHRQAVLDAIRQLGAIDIAMEHFGARDQRPKDECLRLIREESDIFVGIYAHRYGHIPAGDAISITEAEYNAATAAGLTRLIYLAEEASTTGASSIDSGEAAVKLQALKEKLKGRHMCSSFSNKDQLATKVAADLGRIFSGNEFYTPEGHRGIMHQPEKAWKPQLSQNRWRYKVVAFDLDGTLLRGDGFQFSWEAIWNGLGFAKSVQTDLKREYRQKSQLGHDDAERIQAYKDWCRKACDHFIARKLNKDMLSGFAKPLWLTNNFFPAIARLRSEGFVLAVISGGVNSFLEEKIPDFRKLLDFVFINELLFDEQGLLSDVVATEFDFEGKAKALEYVCERTGCGTDEAVFVGDGFNDEVIMLNASRSIAYPPRDRPVEAVSQVLIREDNLELILPHVCVE